MKNMHQDLELSKQTAESVMDSGLEAVHKMVCLACLALEMLSTN